MGGVVSAVGGGSASPCFGFALMVETRLNSFDSMLALACSRQRGHPIQVRLQALCARP